MDDCLTVFPLCCHKHLICIGACTSMHAGDLVHSTLFTLSLNVDDVAHFYFTISICVSSVLVLYRAGVSNGATIVDAGADWEALSPGSTHNKQAFCPRLAAMHPHSAYNVTEKERLYPSLPKTHLSLSQILGSVRKGRNLNRVMGQYAYSNAALAHTRFEIDLCAFRSRTNRCLNVNHWLSCWFSCEQ